MEHNKVILQSPLGSWNNLHPTFSKQVRALLKKMFLIKCRTASSIVEIVVAFFIPILGLMGYRAGGIIFENTPSPNMNPVDYKDMMNWFLTNGQESQVICMPDKPFMHYLMDNTTDLKTIIHGGNLNGTSMPGTDLKYVNSLKELKQYVNSNDNNNIGFEWENIDSSDALTNPSTNPSLNGTSMPGTDLKYVNSLKELKQYVNSNDNNNIGFEWENIDSSDALTNPLIRVSRFRYLFSDSQFSNYNAFIK